MEKFIYKIGLFLILISSNLNAQALKIYLGSSNIEVTTLLPNIQYNISTTNDNNRVSFLIGSIEKEIIIGTSFSFTSSELNSFKNSGYKIKTWESYRLWECVRLCHSTRLREFGWVYYTRNILHYNSLWTINGKTTTATSITQIQQTNCVVDPTIKIQLISNEVNNATYKWYKNNTLFSTTSINTSAFVTVENNDVISVTHTLNGYLESYKKNITLIVLGKPNIPTIVKNSICKGDYFTITATSLSENVEWFEDIALTIQIQTGLSNNGKSLQYLGNFQGSKTIYVRSKNRTCFSNATSVQLNVYPDPIINNVTGKNGSFCGNTANFKVNGQNIDTVKWYSGIEALNTQVISNSIDFNYNISSLNNGSNSIYYIAKSSNNCSSEITKVSFTKQTNAGSISTVSKTEYCNNENVIISLSSNSSISYQWFEDELMNIQAPSQYLQNNGENFTYRTTTIGSKKWYYRGVNNYGCYTILSEITIKTNNAATNLDSTNKGANFCTNETAIFEASATNASNFKFYKNSTGTLLWGSSNVSNGTLSINSNNLNLGENKFWYKAINNSGCETPLKEVSFNIIQAPNVPLRSSGNLIYCLGDTVKITVFSISANSYQWAYDRDFNNLVEDNKIGNSDSSLLQYTPTITGTTKLYFRSIANNCYSSASSLDITINPKVGEITVNNTNTSFCQGETVEIVVGAVNASGGFKWFSDTLGTIPITNITGDKNNTFKLITNLNTPTGTTKLYVRGINDSNCNSELKEVSYTIKETPSNLQVAGNTEYCTGDTVSLMPSANNANSYQWAYDSNFNNLVDNAKVKANGELNYIANATENTTLYYRAVNLSGCNGVVNSVILKVLKGVKNLSITNNNISVCKGKNLIFVATAENATSYKFFDNNGAEIGTSNSLNLDTQNFTPDTYNYKVQAFNTNGCNSEILDFSFTIFDVPNLPTITGNTIYCNNETVHLTANSTGSTFYNWYSDALLNNLITTDISGTKGEIISFKANNVGTLTYYVVAKNSNNCFSESKKIQITINPKVEEITVNNTNNSFCQGETVEIIVGAVNASGGFNWFSDTLGTIPITNITGDKNNTFKLITNLNTPTGTTKLYVRGINDSNCNSELKEVSYTIKETPSNLQVAGNTEYCTGDTVSLMPSANNANSYQWAYDSNFNNLVDNAKVKANGELNYIANATENTTLYYRAVNLSGCNGVVNSVILKVLKGIKNLSITNNNISVCKEENLIFVASAENATSYKFFDNNGAEIETSNSLNLDTQNFTPDTYNYKVQAFNTNGCNSEILDFSFTIFDVPNLPTITGNTIYCNNETVHLTANSTGSTFYNWYSDALLNNLITTDISGTKGEIISFKANNVGTLTYYVVAKNSNNCFSESKKIQITINPKVGEITVNNTNTSFCQGETVEIIVGAVNASGGFNWFSDALGTIPITNITGDKNNTFKLITNLNTPTGTTKLYVRGINDSNCNSQLKEVSYTINYKPINLVLSGKTTVCLGDTVSISLNANFTDNYVWFYDINQVNAINPNWITKINGSSLEFTPTSIGSQRLYYKATNNNCSTDLKSVEIIVKNIPKLLDVTNNNRTFCSNEKAIFEASAFNVHYFEWFKNSDLTLPLEVNFISGGSKNKLTLDTSILGKGDYSYFLVAVNNSGCKTEALQVNFTINEIPLKPSVSGIVSVCIGDYLEMNVISDGATSYKWYYDNQKNFPVDPLRVIGNGASIRIPALTDISGNIYVEGINDSNCVSELIQFSYSFNKAPINLKVNPYTQTVCLGQEIEIELGADNATEYLWWKDRGATIPVEENRINGISNNKVQFITTTSDIGTNSYFIQAKNISGCTTSLEEVKFVVLALPEIKAFTSNSVDFQYLFGEPISFNFNVNNYSKYRILKDGMPLVDWTDGTITNYPLTTSAIGKEKGTYTFEVSNGYCNSSLSITIYVIDVALEILHDKLENIVIVNGYETINIVQADNISFSTNLLSENYSYHWSFGDNFTSSKKIAKHYYHIPGVYEVKLVITNKKSNAKIILLLDTKILVKKSNVSIDINDFEVDDTTRIAFYPNPFKNIITLTINDLESDTDVLVRVFNINGINFFVKKFKAFAGDNIFKWNNPLANAPQGIYLFRLTHSKQTKTFKLIKK
ncbi:T9SS type A sorting domain-containing protein [Tenacibaculum finnmarkense]|uniref:Ig-like domain-containing protein n=2 Tax=Tenacibaculum finnmarkense TaxID=2781243 RepID=UPI00187BC360|nr:T9SS type A sorting domain-containing protein [Tenacibaculum finnmarkense]MBE7649044.1 T9SS type A sorting domain-containing protein [Tenacibaculum finnmarkense genomovar ulcerans]